MDRKSDKSLASNETTNHEEPTLDASSGSKDQADKGSKPTPEERIQTALSLSYLPSLGALDKAVHEDLAEVIEANASHLTGPSSIASIGNAKNFTKNFIAKLRGVGDPILAVSLIAKFSQLGGHGQRELPGDLKACEDLIGVWETQIPADQTSISGALDSSATSILIQRKVLDLGKDSFDDALKVIAKLSDKGKNVTSNSGLLDRWVAMFNKLPPGSGAPAAVPFYAGDKNLQTHVEKHLLHQHDNPDLAEPPIWMKRLPFEVKKTDITSIQDTLKVEAGDLEAIFGSSAKLDEGNKAAADFFFGTFLQRAENKPLIDVLRVKYTAAYEAAATDILAGSSKPFVIDGGGKVQVVGPNDIFISFARIQSDLSLSIMSVYIPSNLGGTVAQEQAKMVWEL